MSLKQAAFLTSRVISLWFFYETFTSLAQLPAALIGLSMARSMSTTPDWMRFSQSVTRSSGTMIVHAILQAIVELALGILFYRFGPRVGRFLMGDEADASSEGGEMQNRQIV
jgi:hypothetical protein